MKTMISIMFHIIELHPIRGHSNITLSLIGGEGSNQSHTVDYNFILEGGQNIFNIYSKLFCDSFLCVLKPYLKYSALKMCT